MRIIHRNEEGAYSWKNYAENNHNIYDILELIRGYLRMTRAEGTSLHGAGS